MEDYNNPSLKRIAANVLMFYLEKQGDTEHERLSALTVAALYCGFKAKVTTKNRGTYINVEGDFSRFHDFQQEIKGIILNGFNNEVRQIIEIILHYKKLNKKWYQFWK